MESLAVQQLFRDVEDEEAWIREKEPIVASNNRGRDLIGVQVSTIWCVGMKEITIDLFPFVAEKAKFKKGKCPAIGPLVPTLLIYTNIQNGIIILF